MVIDTGGWTVHEAFFTLAMRLALARVEMHLWTPLPPRRPESRVIRGVGTTSWFLLPCSTCWGSGQLLVGVVGGGGGKTYSGEDSPVLTGEVT